jgi:AcrR family transcriptional regulator
VFRLFGSKKDLFKASTARCLRETLETFQRAAEGKRGRDALDAMGDAYGELLVDRTRLRAQMQAYAACDDPDIREVVRNGYGDIVSYVERVSGLPEEEVTRFFAVGMLMNVMASMDLWESPEAWSERLLAGCKEET